MIDKLGNSLEKRRAIARVSLLYKIVKCLVVGNTCENFQQLTRKVDTPRITLSNKLPVKLKLIYYLLSENY